MQRQDLIQLAFQRNNLTFSNPTYLKYVENFISNEIKFDLGREGDITTESIFFKNNLEVKAVLRSREFGVVSGLEEVSWLYQKHSIKVKLAKKDGDEIQKGEVLIEIEGDEKNIMKIKRTALNLIQRMSGISTETRNLIKKIENKLIILPTRKTHRGFLDIKAVRVGGGGMHRMGLWDAVLIKNNHLELLRKIGYKNVIEEALDRVKRNKQKGRFVEIEVENKEDAIKAAKKFKELNKGIHIIMFDNMPPEEIKSTIEQMKINNYYDKVLLEASGGINRNNIDKYVDLGLDAVSLGYLTNSIKVLDINQEILIVK